MSVAPGDEDAPGGEATGSDCAEENKDVAVHLRVEDALGVHSEAVQFTLSNG